MPSVELTPVAGRGLIPEEAIVRLKHGFIVDVHDVNDANSISFVRSDNPLQRERLPTFSKRGQMWHDAFKERYPNPGDWMKARREENTFQISCTKNLFDPGYALGFIGGPFSVPALPNSFASGAMQSLWPGAQTGELLTQPVMFISSGLGWFVQDQLTLNNMTVLPTDPAVSVSTGNLVYLFTGSHISGPQYFCRCSNYTVAGGIGTPLTQGITTNMYNWATVGFFVYETNTGLNACNQQPVGNCVLNPVSIIEFNPLISNAVYTTTLVDQIQKQDINSCGITCTVNINTGLNGEITFGLGGV